MNDHKIHNAAIVIAEFVCNHAKYYIEDDWRAVEEHCNHAKYYTRGIEDD